MKREHRRPRVEEYLVEIHVNIGAPSREIAEQLGERIAKRSNVSYSDLKRMGVYITSSYVADLRHEDDMPEEWTEE